MNVVQLNQGQEANRARAFLEGFVEKECQSLGILVVDHRISMDNLDMFARRRLVRRVPFTSIFGMLSHTEFVLENSYRRIRIECKCQEGAGSCDEKLVYLFHNARDAMPENEIILLLHGDGFRTAAVDWLRRACHEYTSKQIQVHNISQFRLWLKRFAAEAA